MSDNWNDRATRTYEPTMQISAAVADLVVDEQKKQIAQLTQRLAELSEAFMRAEQRVQQVEAELAELQEDYAIREGEIEELRSHVGALHRIRGVLEAENRALRERQALLTEIVRILDREKQVGGVTHHYGNLFDRYRKARAALTWLPPEPDFAGHEKVSGWPVEPLTDAGFGTEWGTEGER